LREASTSHESEAKNNAKNSNHENQETIMTQNPNDQKTCGVCHQTFNSAQELQEHQKTAHSQQKQGGGNQPMSDRNQPGQDQKREKIA
jgi:hypothetical protein